MYASERTPLSSFQPGPPYVFMANPHRAYRKQIRQFQCCVCTTIISIFLSALIITILYSVDNDTIDNNPTPASSTPSLTSDNSSLQTLMQVSFPLKDELPPGWSGPFPNNEQLLTAVQKGKQANAKKAEIEKNMPLMLRDSPTFRYRQAQKTSKEATKLAEYGHVMEEVTKQFSSISGKSAGRGPKVAFSLLDNPACTETNLDACPSSRYRFVNGLCNNLNHSWGVAMSPFRRTLPPAYADGVSVPRTSVDNSPLPSAREVSLTIHRPEYRDDPKFTVMLAVWGQFLDHDLTATALSQGQNGEPITCCAKTPESAHPECMPVRITPDDPKFKDSGTDCLDFVRSAPAPSCTLGPREQLNQATSFLDASVVYGSDDALAKKLRSFKNGKMLISRGKDGKVLLPMSRDPNDGCNEEEENKKGRYCFMAGDPRSNENVLLTSMHLLFVRQHNHMAEWLASMNPDWDDEKIYQESRHIVAAQMQHITYNEFLPVVLGPKLMTHLQLQPQTSGYWNGYNETTDPTIANNFAASSFRFAHTLLPGLMKVAAQHADSYEAVELHRMLFDPYKLYAAGYLAKAIKGALVTHLERADTYFTPELTQRLFEKDADNATDIAGKKPVCGLDLVSLNIQRGRDHGIPPYPSWREHCGFKRPKSFEDLNNTMDDESLKKMASIYKSVEDVDLYTGSLSEVPIEGGLLGPTATCLLTDQFKRLKDGDRYWYETSMAPQRFTRAQLNEIRKTSLAGIICDTSDGVEESQPFVMQSVSPSNKRMPCSEIPRPDLRVWKPTYRGRVNISLVAGNIKTQDEVMVWEGTLPVALTLPAYIGSPDISQDVPLKVSGGIQWFSSSLQVVDQNTIYVNGSFSAPEYLHSPDDSKSKVRWANGNFELKFHADTDFDWEAVQGQLISSPVYFKVVKDMKVPLPDLEESSKKFILETPSTKKFVLQSAPSVSKENFILESSPRISHQTITLQQSPKEVKTPIFLEGKFSEDRTEFFWGGEAFVLLPTIPAKAEATDPAKQTQSSNDASDEDIGFDRDWVIVPKSNPIKRESIPSGGANASPPDMPKDEIDEDGWVIVPKSNPTQPESIPNGDNNTSLPDAPSKAKTGEDDPSNTSDVDPEVEHFAAMIGNNLDEADSKVKTLHQSQLQFKGDRDKEGVFYKKESIPGHHMNESEADSEWELVPGTISDYRRKGSKDPNHLGPGEPPRNRNALDDYIDAQNAARGHNNTVKAGADSENHSKEFVLELKPVSALGKEHLIEADAKYKTLHQSQLQFRGDRDKEGVFYKKESIPGHHMNESEADSEWELVPGTISDYRRKGSKDPNHLGPGEPPRNRNALDDYIDAQNAARGHNNTVKAGADQVNHLKEPVLELKLQAVPAITEDSTAAKEKNRLLIKIDPSISLFPAAWKYDNVSKIRLIPVDYFYKVNTTARTSKPVILWNAKRNANMLLGNVSVPEFVLDGNNQRRVVWQNTTFSLNYQPEAEDSLHLLETGRVLHNSRIVLKDLKCTHVENVSNDFETLDWQLDTFQKVSLIQAGHSLPTSDIILLGEFTENKTEFEWNGSIMFKFARPGKVDKFEVAMEDVNSDWSAIPLKVLSFSINVDSVNGKPSPKGWSSLTPNSFPIAALANNHVTDVNSALLWTGHVEGDKLRGNFTLPIFQTAKTQAHLLKGTFEMRLRANLPQLSWSSKKPAYTGPYNPHDPPGPPGPPPGAHQVPPGAQPRPNPREPHKEPPKQLVIVPYLDTWPPPPSFYPKTFPIPFPLNISASPSDPAVPMNPVHDLEGTLDEKVDQHQAKDSGKGPSLLHWSPGKVLSQKDLSKLIKPSPASSHLVLNTVPWPPVFPKWPADKPPPPWEQPYPFADSNAEPHPDEPFLARSMELEEKNAHVKLNSKATQTEWADAGGDKKPARKVNAKSAKEKTGMLHASPASVKPAPNNDVEKLTALYMKKLATVIKPGVQYATKLLVKSRHGVKYDAEKLNVSQNVASLLKNSVASKMIVDGDWKDNNDYYWPGNAVLMVAPPAPAKPTLKKLGDPIGILPWFKGPYATIIVDGSVTAGTMLTGSSTVWSGQMPTSIPLPVSWAKANVSIDSGSKLGIHWTPTLVSYSRVEGTYFLDGASNSSAQSGVFRFELYPRWGDTTVNKFLITGQKYYSKVTIEALPDWMKYATAPQGLADDPPEEEEKPAPVTIRGNFNADQTIFEWAGDGIMNVP